ncbi:hypothetical protein SpCBS45565_g00879 [Spizellomyces sp. 'palustris']|nr:hypothetical protein SpCBS45565_g00879 [Spizellomyces sp. 'palustris']
MKEIILKESTASSKRPTGIILNVDSAVAERIDSGSKMTIRCGTKNVIRINTPRKKPFELELAEWEQMTLDLYRLMSSPTQARHVTTIGTCCRIVTKKEAKQRRPISLSDFAEQQNISKEGENKTHVPPVKGGKEPSLESTFRRERVTSTDDQPVKRKVSSKTELPSARATVAGGITETPVASRPKARSKTLNLAPEIHRERTVSSEGHVVKRKVPSDAEGRSKERKASARTKAAPSSSSLKQSIKDVPDISIQRITSIEAQTIKRKVPSNAASNSRANRLTGTIKSAAPSVNSAPPSGTPESTPERVINPELVKLSERPPVKRKASATSESRSKEKKLGKLVPSSCSPDPSPKMRKSSSNAASDAHKPISTSSNSSSRWRQMSIPELKAYTQRLQQKADEVEHELNTLCARDEEFQSRLDEIMLSDAPLQYDELGEIFPEMKEPDALFERWDDCLARREALASEGEAIKGFLMERNRKMRARIGI